MPFTKQQNNPGNCLMPVTHDIKKAVPEGSQIQSHKKCNIETLSKSRNIKRKQNLYQHSKIKNAYKTWSREILKLCW